MDQLLKNPPAMQETWVPSLGLIPGLGRSPGEGNSYPLQYPGLESSMACRVHGVAKSQTQLSNFHFISLRHVVNKNEEKALRRVKCEDGATIKIPVSVGERSAQ